MFTQFLGNYLLNEQLVSPELLSEVLHNLKSTRVKLGVLAINAGYITADQAELVHNEQQRTDKRMGDIMTEMGLITKEQLDELLGSQKCAHLMLGQALIDSGNMTTSQFATALNNYKKQNEITDSDFNEVNDDKVKHLLQNFYNIKGENGYMIVEYVSLLLKNLIRFIGDDFIPLQSEKICNYYCTFNSSQVINDQDASTLVVLDADENVYLEIASRFAGERITVNGDFAQASVGEFLNLQNGLFCVNISNDIGKELLLEPQTSEYGMKLKHMENAYKIPISYPFGTVNFIIRM